MTYTLQLLHANDLEGGVDALDNAPNFAAIVDHLEDTHANSILVSSGDNYIPGPFFSTAADFSMGGTLDAAYTRLFTEVLGQDLSGVTLDMGRGGGRVDVTIMNILGFDASVLGNHEFDPGTSALASIIRADGAGGTIEWPGAMFPYLSANLDFSGDGNLSGLFTDQILTSDQFNESLADLANGVHTPDIAPATIIERGGEKIGVVGATTQLIESISSTGGVDEITGGSNNMAALAAVLQPQINALIGQGVNKIIVTSHLQQISLEKELAGLLNGVDIIIAGGSNTLQADGQDRLRSGDEVEDAYPFVTTNADNDPSVIVGTDGEYTYVGRLVVDFDDNGVLQLNSIDANVSGVFATDEQGVLDVTGAATLEDALSGSTKADIVKDLTDAVSAIVDAADAVLHGFHDVYLDGRRGTVRTEESNLGNLTADANLAAARSVDASVAVSFKNGGGIRAEIGASTDTGLDEGDGQVSQLDIDNSLRFNNDLTLITVTAEGLIQLLEHAVSGTDTDAGATPGRFAQVGGIRFSFDESRPAQQLATDGNGDYITDPATGLVQTTTAGSRIQTVALVDPVSGADIVIYRDGMLTLQAPAEIRMVTLNFLVDNNGDGYPFQELATDIRYLTEDGGTTVDGDAPNLLGEQKAFADFMMANHGTEDDAFAKAETDVFNDTRIIQLERNGGRDLILSDEPDASVEITRVGQLDSGETELFTGGSEVVATEGGKAFVTNGAQDRIDIFNLNDQSKAGMIDLSSIADYDGVQSVAVKNGIVAAAVSRDGDANGVVALFQMDGTPLGTIEVGNLPDMVTFTPDGSKILVAGEGEPTDSSDPAGTIGIIDISNGVANAQTTLLDFTAFDGQEQALFAQSVLLEPGKSVSEDLEPEYITVLPDGNTAWVSLQEANAYAVVDLTTNSITAIRSFGLIDRSQPGFELDPSNRDNAINLQTFDNLFGMRQPDAITSMQINGQTYVFTANEGDARDHTEDRVKDLTLDPSAFPNADLLQQNENLGRLKIRTDIGDTDGDGDHDQLFHYGARSFTVYDVDGNVVYDSGSTFSRLIAEIRPDLFNHDDRDFDDRSDDKGVEPEAIAVGMVDDRPLLFVGLERDSGVFVFDVSDPANPAYVNYINGDLHGNISPETIAFIPAADSTSGKAQILIAYEGDGNTAVYDVALAAGETLTGNERNNVLETGDGDDLIDGLAGHDLLSGNGGNDTLNGGDGNDWIMPGAGRNLIDGGAGNDMLSYADASQGVHVDLARGRVLTADGEDFVRNIERVTGTSHDDSFRGGFGDDTFRGLAGDDFFDFRLGGDDVANGGAGRDGVSYLGAFEGVEASLLRGRGSQGEADGDRYMGIEKLTGTLFEDTLTGARTNDVLNGHAGDDILIGNAGDDYLIGGLGTDIAVFNFNQDQYQVVRNGFATTVSYTGMGAGDGDDLLAHVEILRFADGDLIL
jgi:alkaline phosphatase